MELRDVAAICVLVFVYGLVSARLDRSAITPAMFFTGAGLVLGTAALSRLDSLPSGSLGSLIAEATLVFVLFTDASRIKVGQLRRHLGLPARLLTIGMPLQILLGLLLAKLLLPELGWWEARQVLVGAGVGLAVGFFGARLIDWASSRQWFDSSFRQITSLAVAVAAYALAHLGDGNGFIAAFVAGGAFGAATPRHCHSLVEFAEEEGQLLALLTFLLFGAAKLDGPLERLSPAVLAYAVLSLTAIRMVPVALALLGAGLQGPTVAFLGGFGPRGLASILFTLLIVEAPEVGNMALIVDVALVTVLLSVLLHGATARPFSRLLSRHLAGKTTATEHHAMPEMTRGISVPASDSL